MTIIATIKPNWKLAIGLPLCIYLACFLITLLPTFKLHQGLLSNAIVMDLLITAPLAYFFAIRKTRVSKFTIARVFIAGLLIAPLILSTHSNTLLHFIKLWVSPLVEGTVIFVIGRKFYAANKKARQTGHNNTDFLLYCRMLMCRVTGNEIAGNIISSEIAVVYYAFMGRKDKGIDYKIKFTSYKENGIILVLATFLSLFLIEATGTHFILALWNSTAAWILTALSFYTCIQLYAHIKAIRARPIHLGAASLGIHNGLAGDAIITYDNIEKIELSNKIPVGRNQIKIALIRGLENHNCVVYLKQPIYVTKIFGIKKTTNTVLFFVDRPKEFLIAMNLKLADTAI